MPLPLAVDDVVLRALDKRPEGRFATVTEFYDALRATVPTVGPFAAHVGGDALEVVIEARRRTPRDAETDDDDGIDEKIAELMETAEEDLEDGAWQIELSTTTALAARLSLQPQDGADLDQAEVARLCEQLFERLAARAGTQIQLDMKLRVRDDRHAAPRTVLARKAPADP